MEHYIGFHSLRYKTLKDCLSDEIFNQKIFGGNEDISFNTIMKKFYKLCKTYLRVGLLSVYQLNKYIFRDDDDDYCLLLLSQLL